MSDPAAPLTDDELQADCVGSFFEAVRAIAEAVRRGERELPACFIPRPVQACLDQEPAP